MPKDGEQNDEQDQQQQQQEQKAPWGDNFDAARAWQLVQNLRADIDKIKGERDTLASERQAREDAEKTENEKLTGKLTKAEQDFKDAQRALFVERAIRKHSIPEDLAEFLTGDTEEEIEKKAERLSKVGRSDESGDSHDDDADPQARPKVKLTPGHGGDPATPFDADAVADAARTKSRY